MFTVHVFSIPAVEHFELLGEVDIGLLQLFLLLVAHTHEQPIFNGDLAFLRVGGVELGDAPVDHVARRLLGLLLELDHAAQVKFHSRLLFLVLVVLCLCLELRRDVTHICPLQEG